MNTRVRSMKARRTGGTCRGCKRLIILGDIITRHNGRWLCTDCATTAAKLLITMTQTKELPVPGAVRLYFSPRRVLLLQKLGMSTPDIRSKMGLSKQSWGDVVRKLGPNRRSGQGRTVREPGPAGSENSDRTAGQGPVEGS